MNPFSCRAFLSSNTVGFILGFIFNLFNIQFAWAGADILNSLSVFLYNRSTATKPGLRFVATRSRGRGRGQGGGPHRAQGAGLAGGDLCEGGRAPRGREFHGFGAAKRRRAPGRVSRLEAEDGGPFHPPSTHTWSKMRVPCGLFTIVHLFNKRQLFLRFPLRGEAFLALQRW